MTTSNGGVVLTPSQPTYAQAEGRPGADDIVRWIGILALAFGIVEALGFIGGLPATWSLLTNLFNGRVRGWAWSGVWWRLVYLFGFSCYLLGGVHCLRRLPSAQRYLLVGSLLYLSMDAAGIAIFAHNVATIRSLGFYAARDPYWIGRLTNWIFPYLIPAALTVITAKAWLHSLTFAQTSDAPDASPPPTEASSPTLTYAGSPSSADAWRFELALNGLRLCLGWMTVLLAVPVVMRLFIRAVVEKREVEWTRAARYHFSAMFWSETLQDWSGLVLFVAGLAVLYRRRWGARLIVAGALLEAIATFISDSRGGALFWLSPIHWAWSLKYAFVAILVTRPAILATLAQRDPLPALPAGDTSDAPST